MPLTGMAETFTPPTPTEALRLADIHIRRYQNFLEAASRGEPGYRPEELHALIATWESVVDAQGEWSKLTQAARSEVMDAVDDEPVAVEPGIEMPTIRPLADYLMPMGDDQPSRFLADAAYRDRLSVAMSDDDAARASLARVAPFEDEYDVPR